MCAPLFVKLFCKTHAPVDVKIVVEPFLELIFIHETDVHEKVKLCCVGEGLLRNFILIRKLFKHEVKEVDTCVRLRSKLGLEHIDTLLIQATSSIDVIARCHIEYELG